MDTIQRNKSTAEGVKRIEDSSVNALRHPYAFYSPEYRTLLQECRKLSVNEHHQKFLDLYQDSRVLVLSSETGSGKSTQIPKLVLYDEIASGLNVICTQPRRIAAKAVSERVAEEMDVELGEEVGYNVRFDKMVSGATRLLYVTEEVLLQEITTHRDLSKYATVIIDEVHERTTNTDLLLAMLKQTLLLRKSFKVVIMSATPDIAKIKNYFENSVYMHIPGRVFPVRNFHLEQATVDYVSAAVRTVKHIHKTRGSGHIMIFMMGEEELERTCANIRRELPELDTLSLYSSMTIAKQARMFRESSARKCIVTTSVAETSLTIPGVAFVIDTGLVKHFDYNPRARMDMPRAMPISKDSATQRAGSAGRTQPGECFRLYSKESYDNIMPPSPTPEMLRVSMSGVILKLKACGYDDVWGFDYIDRPAPECLLQACGELNDCGYIDDSAKLTAEGKVAASFPIDAVWYRALRVAATLGCSAEMLSIACVLSHQTPIFLHPHTHRHIAELSMHQFSNALSDHITHLNTFNAFWRMRDQHEGNLDQWCFENFLNRRVLEEILQLRHDVGSFLLAKTDIALTSRPLDHPEYEISIRKALAIGFHTHAAIVHDNNDGYKTVHGNMHSLLHPTCALVGAQHEWVVYHKFTLLGKPYLQVVTAILPEWIADLPYFQDNRLAKNFHGDLLQKFVKDSLTAARGRAGDTQH